MLLVAETSKILFKIIYFKTVEHQSLFHTKFHFIAFACQQFTKFHDEIYLKIIVQFILSNFTLQVARKLF